MNEWLGRGGVLWELGGFFLGERERKNREKEGEKIVRKRGYVEICK